MPHKLFERKHINDRFFLSPILIPQDLTRCYTLNDFFEFLKTLFNDEKNLIYNWSKVIPHSNLILEKNAKFHFIKSK